ncbi:hypothetical protein ACST14_10155 [Aquirufa sp. A-Brett2-15D]
MRKIQFSLVASPEGKSPKGMSPKGKSPKGSFTIHHLPFTISTLLSLLFFMLSNYYATFYNHLTFTIHHLPLI